MGARENLQKLIDKKQEEIEELKTSLTHASIYLQALYDSMKALPKEPSGSYSGKIEVPKLREGSMLWTARQSLLAAKKPLHINDLLVSMGKNADEKERLSLTGSIGWYVRKGRVFTRPAPNTFGLVELADNAHQGAVQTADTEGVTLPETFGE